jgi:hypothetical protein
MRHAGRFNATRAELPVSDWLRVSSRVVPRLNPGISGMGPAAAASAERAAKSSGTCHTAQPSRKCVRISQWPSSSG